MCATPLERSLSLFPLWSLLLGVVTGIYTADHNEAPLSLYGWLYSWLCYNDVTQILTGTISVTLITILLLTLTGFTAKFHRQAILLLILGFSLGNGIFGSQINRQKSWVYAIQAGTFPRNSQLSGTIVDANPAQGSYILQVQTINNAAQTTSASTPPVKGLRMQLSPSALSAPSENQPTLEQGDLVTLTGYIQTIPPPRNPNGFNQARWLHRQGVDLTIVANQPIQTHGISWRYQPARTMAKLRLKLRTQITTGLEPDSQEAQLIRAVVLGERPPRQSSMIQDFRNSGTLHVFAVSGLHVGMVGTLIGGLLWFLRTPRWILIGGVVAGMAVYAGITGFKPPAVRAVLMASLYLSGFLIKRRPSLINSLAASAIIVLLWNGHQLFTPGFQLSYGVLLSLALASSFWMRVLKPMATIDPFMPWLLLSPWQERILNGKTWLKNSLAVSLAAWMGSAPLMWIHFGIITPIGILAGIPLMILVFLILALAMLGVTLGIIWSPASKTINQTNAWIAKTTYHIAHQFARVPGGHWNPPPQRPTKGQIIVFDLPDGGGANFIDVGGGILLDCGRSDHFYRHVLPTLTALRAEPDSLIVSHADSKHSGAMARCLHHFRPKQALLPRTDLLSRSYRDFLSKTHTAHCQLIIPHTGQVFPIEPGVYLHILHAPAELTGQGRADDTGLVIRLHWHGWRILFMGDAGFITETRLLESGLDLRADVIITGRNRDDFTGRESFYQAVSPQAIISSHCHFPEHEHIPKSWFKMVQQQGITIFDQQQSGAVTLTIDHQLDHQKLILTPILNTAKPMTIRR